VRKIKTVPADVRAIKIRGALYGELKPELEGMHTDYVGSIDRLGDTVKMRTRGRDAGRLVVDQYTSPVPEENSDEDAAVLLASRIRRFKRDNFWGPAFAVKVFVESGRIWCIFGCYVVADPPAVIKPVLSPAVAREVRESGYLHLIEKLRGLEERAQDNTYSAHALHAAVVQIIKNEIEYPTI